MKPYYSEGGIEIFHGDCREVLLTLPAVDCVITDPPYKMTASGGGMGAKRAYLAAIDGRLDEGFDLSLLAPFDNWFVFCGKEQLPEMLSAVGGKRWMLLTWNKTNPTPLTNNNYLPDTEYIFHCFTPGRLFGSYRDKSRFIVHPVEKSAFDHPTVKPLAVMEKCVRLGTKAGDLVLDPFCGTGTTLEAAKLLGRRAIGIEREERFCEMAASRLSQGVLAFGPAP